MNVSPHPLRTASLFDRRACASSSSAGPLLRTLWPDAREVQRTKNAAPPASHAVFLACSVEEIYAARKRRKRVLEKILAVLDGGDKEDA